MKLLTIIFKKELKDMLRDRRTLFSWLSCLSW